MRRLLVLGLCAGACAMAAPASAQSKRYPPTPVDKDAAREAKSKLWSAALTPERHPYQQLVRSAIEAMGRRTSDQTLEAIHKLDEAIQLLPHEPEAYRLRGEAHLERKDWAKCAADLAAADAYTLRDDQQPRTMAELRRKLGMCQARAGKLADAERTLAETAASGNASGEAWMRLGEVRVAMGKLDEAIAALRSALETTEPAAQAMVRFLLATAYDRARRPGDALVEAAEGVKLDRQLTSLLNPSVPPLSPGELDYMLGLAYSVDPARPELALVSFRRFRHAAQNSPWSKRVEEHIRDLAASQLPESIQRTGTAPLDLEAARVAVRRVMPQMRACMSTYPEVVVEVEISRAGPRTPATDRMRPRYFTPPDGVTVRGVVGALAPAELVIIDRCLQPIVARIALPAVKERDTYYKARFHVVSE